MTVAKREEAQYSDVPKAYRMYEDPRGGWGRDPDFPSSAITYVPCDTDEGIPCYSCICMLNMCGWGGDPR